jgi:hypothetical protein
MFLQVFDLAPLLEVTRLVGPPQLFDRLASVLFRTLAPGCLGQLRIVLPGPPPPRFLLVGPAASRRRRRSGGRGREPTP